MKKPTGYCANGHEQQKHGFVDSENNLRCRICRHLRRTERAYWKLVKKIIDNENDEEALAELKNNHWRIP